MVIKENNKLQKRNPEIIEDASFYQDVTYIALMKQIDKAAKEGKSKISIYDSTTGTNMKKYLEKKGFIITKEHTNYITYIYLEW